MQIYMYICNAPQHTSTRCTTLQRRETQNSMSQSCHRRQRSGFSLRCEKNATLCNTLHHTAPHCRTLQHCYTLQHTATHCNTLQHTATHCNTQKRNATRDCMDQIRRRMERIIFSIPCGENVLFISLLCVAVCCSVLQCVAVLPCGENATHCNTLRHTATHCDTLRHTEEK